MQELSETQMVEMYYIIDEFCAQFNQTMRQASLEDGRKHRNKPSRLTDAEVILILILFHIGGYRCLKHYYINHICKHCNHLFPKHISYNRFVERQQSVLLQLGYFVKTVLMAECTGISFIDSTPLRVCKNQRIHIHKVFKGIAQRGKCSMGWFFGFKLHLIINEKGEILNFMVTPGNVDDRTPLSNERFIKDLYGKLVADRGYISKSLFQNLFINDIQLITKFKDNMKNALMSCADRILLRKRNVIESVNDELKNMATIEHSRHRSVVNFLTNTLAAVAAYQYFPKKPSLNLVPEHTNQLALF